MRPIHLPLFCVAFTACYDNPPPQVPRPQLPPAVDGATLDVASRVEQERRPVTHSSRVCGGGDCSTVSVTSRETVDVTHAKVSYGGSPLTFGQALSIGDPTYVEDWTKMDKLAANCRHATIPKYVGEILTTLGMIVFIDGTATSDGSVNMPYAVGGGAAIVAGIGAYALGKYALGGQDCAEANEIYKRREDQYNSASDADVENSRAEELETIANQFNAKLGRASRKD